MSIKIWAYVALVALLLGGLKWAHGEIYKAGYNAAVTTNEAELEAIRDEIRAEEKVKWQAIVDAAEGTIVVEEVIVEKVRVVEKKVPEYIDRIVEVKPECADLPDLASLFSQQASASRGGTGGSPDITPEPD